MIYNCIIDVHFFGCSSIDAAQPFCSHLRQTLCIIYDCMVYNNDLVNKWHEWFTQEHGIIKGAVYLRAYGIYIYI